ncbi:DUF423 domain-containing protein [Thalassoroseus pseudoceratinae]|uniref:DUF423 domain-containing protein n=1 Tax=Thalassoroseus pseudoceratinae TaxID=2713176 RepID=UPI0014206304|nr:DUF423 domain-containing protein [Thalassoroseus pseudoceratinae]
MTWSALGAVLAGLAVVTGAFAAHGLDGVLQRKYDGQSKTVLGREIPAAEKYLGDFKTAAHYQMVHALALLFVGLLSATKTSTSLQIAGWSFLVGIVVFSGSLYLLVVAGPRWLGVPWGAITPIGGVAFLVGWAALFFATLAKSPAGS